MGNPSFKKELIKKISTLTLLDEFNNSKVIIVSAFGVITGKLCIPPSDDEIKGKQIGNDIILTKLTKKFVDDYKKEFDIPNEVSLKDNDGSISLAEVSIKTSGNTINMPHLNVFVDQIIGITIGNI